ncbi:MAG: WD40 repeat domain-containing protein, partial [Chloroflexota bacterium]
DVALQSAAAQVLLTRSLTQREAKSRRQLRLVQGIAGVLAVFLLIAAGAGWMAFQNAVDARESLALALATTASTWPDADEAFVLALAAVRLDAYTERKQVLASDFITQYALLNEYGEYGGFVGMVYSPDGATVLSGSYDGTLWLWQVSTGELLQTFEGHEGRVTSVAYSPDGATVLSGSVDRTLRLWDVSTGEILRTFEGHEDRVNDVAYSPDGQTVLSGSHDGTLRLWEVNTGAMLRTFEGHANWVSSVAYSPDGQTVLSGSCSNGDVFGCMVGDLRLWEVTTGEALWTFEGIRRRGR